MDIREIIPFSTQKFSFLPDDDQEWIVHDLQELRFDPNNPDRFGIMVQIYPLPDRTVTGSDFSNAMVKSRRIFVPFSSFGFFGIGNIFQNGRMIERASGHVNIYKSIFKPRFFVDGYFGRFGKNLSVAVHESFVYPIDDPDGRILDYKIPILRGRDGNQPAYLFMWEIIRFYLAGFSRLSEALITRHAFPEIEQPPLYVEAETGLDGRTFVISPSEKFADRATATQLAIILAHTDITDLLKAFSTYLRLVRDEDPDILPRITMPSGAEALRLAVRKIGVLPADGRTVNGRLYGQIISDGRELAFDRLVIRDPRARRVSKGLKREDPDLPDQPPLGSTETIPWETGRDDLHGGDPSIGEKEEVSSTFSIDHHFTGLKQVPVNVKRSTIIVPKPPRFFRKKDPSPGNQQPRFEKKFTDSGGAPVKGLWRFRQNMTPETMRLGAGQKLFLPVDVLPFEAVPIHSVKIDARIQATLDAVQRLRRLSIIRQSTLPKFGSPEAIRLKIDLNGGSARLREVVFGFVKIAGRHGVWIEVVRRGEGAISLGLVLRRDGRKIERKGVVRILEHFSRRVGLRGVEDRDALDAYSGVWPVARNYDDIIGERITHNPPNNIAYYLSKTLEQKFCEMSTKVSMPHS